MNVRLTTILLRSPVLVTMVLFMLAPMALAVVYSFMTNGAYGGVRMPFTALAYRQLLFQEDFDGNLVFSTGYLAILWRSVLLAATTAPKTSMAPWWTWVTTSVMSSGPSPSRRMRD